MDGQARFHDWLIGAPAAQRMEFENLIEERANVLWRDQSGKSVAVASIPTGTVAAWVAQHMPASAKPDENALNRNAAALAGKDAKARLREQLLQMDLGDGRTLAKAVEDNPAIGSQLDGIQHVVTFDEYPATGIPGVCKAKIYFDKNIARGLAVHPRKRWWLF